jgi:toxin ParE1/3/4
MKRFVLTPRAKQDINEIWDYIADDNIEAAERVLGALEAAMLKLAKSPTIGHWREELTDRRHRFFLVFSYLIVYRHETKPLQIIRVIHAARDVQSILGLTRDEPQVETD